MLDVAVRGEDQRLGRPAGGQLADVLGEQQMEPAEPVVAGDGDDAVVREVHQTLAVGEGALFAEQIAVVRGDTFVLPFGGHGTGQGEERAGR